MQARCYFDYTCAYSFRVWRWLGGQVRPLRPDLELEWVGFSLKEANRADGESVFAEVGDPRLSVVALALAAAARERGGERFHDGAFSAFHSGGPRVTRDDLLALAVRDGVDVDRFWRERRVWIDRVASEHSAAVQRWGVFGTPTLVIDDEAVYLKIGEVPADERQGVRLWEAVETLAVQHPDLVEIKRPVVPAARP
jgi:hypothetical protein